MLEEKQREVENLTKELEEMRPQAEGISADIQVLYVTLGVHKKTLDHFDYEVAVDLWSDIIAMI